MLNWLEVDLSVWRRIWGYDVIGMTSKGMTSLRKVRKALNQDALLTMYYSFIYPYIQRGAGIWANTCKRYMLDILLKQKQAVRIIAGARYLDHTVPLFKELNILPIDLLYKQQLLILMYNTFHKKCPEHIAYFFKLKGEVQINIRTRQANDYHIPNAKLKIHSDSPIIQAPKL